MVGDRFKIKNKCTVCIQEVYISINYLSQLRSSSFNTPIYKHDLSGIFTFLSVKGKDRSFCQIICQQVMHRNLQTPHCFLPIFHFMHIIHITVITYMNYLHDMGQTPYFWQSQKFINHPHSADAQKVSSTAMAKHHNLPLSTIALPLALGQYPLFNFYIIPQLPF